MEKPVIHFYESRMEGTTMCNVPISSLDDAEHSANSRFVTCRKCLKVAGLKPPGRVTRD